MMAIYDYMEPRILSRVLHRKIVLSRTKKNRNAGLHASRSRGGGIDFLQHREYYPGDEPKSIDWRLSARRDHVFVREFESDSTITAAFFLDESRSMDYTSSPVNHTKYDYGKRLVSHLSFFFLNQRDRVRLVRLRESSHGGGHHREPYMHSFRQVIATLEKWSSGGAMSLSSMLRTAFRHNTEPRLNFVLSDFIDREFLAEVPLSSFNAGPGKTILVKINDPSEISFPFKHFRRFHDPESGEKLLADPALVRERYMASFTDHTESLVEFARKTGGRLVSVSTGEELEFALDTILSAAGG